MAQTQIQTKGFKAASRKVSRMPREIRNRVKVVTRTTSSAFLSAVNAGTPVRTGRLKRSNRRRLVPGSRGVAWAVSSGNRDAFYPHIIEGGSSAGIRTIRRGKRKGQTFKHPGTRATGYFYGRRRLVARQYRLRMNKAYREGARATK